MELTGVTPEVRGNRKLPREGVKRILIRGTNWIGDAVMTIPAIRAIRKAYPEAYIGVLAKPWVADVYQLLPEVDETVYFYDPGIHQGAIGKIRLARELRKKEFDIAILLQNAMEAAIITSLAGIKIRAGYNTDLRGFLLTHSVLLRKELKHVHQTLYYLEMVKALGCQNNETEVKLEPDEDVKRRIVELIDRYDLKNKKIVGIAPGATYGPAKIWPLERFAKVADLIKERGNTTVLLFGSKNDRRITSMVKSICRHETIDLGGRTSLREAFALISCCNLFISNDSGLMHLAAAFGVPTVAIFGSTNPKTTSPLGPKTKVIYKNVPCSPCLRKKCPTDFRCMLLITPEEVFESAKELGEI
ncbi:MAG: lipopolysaccharide heptosyltransferase II [Syntrophales bacterium]|nr:lipopolysaccharide heptosyltransferase II [Syntrophales bacterium]